MGRVFIVVCATVAFTVLMGSFVFLSYSGKDTASLVSFVMGLATAVVPQIAAYFKTHQTAKAVEHMQEDMQTVKEQTNGPLKEAIGDMGVLVAEVRKQNGNGD